MRIAYEIAEQMCFNRVLSKFVSIPQSGGGPAADQGGTDVICLPGHEQLATSKIVGWWNWEVNSTSSREQMAQA
jgi:hypothetical protein